MVGKETIEIWWTFGIPFIALNAFIANLISSVVFKQMLRSSSNSILKYMFIKSASISLYLLICCFVFIIKCKTICPPMSKTFQLVAKIYELYFFNYLSSCLGFFDLLLEVSRSTEQLFIILNRRSSKAFPFVINGLLFISLVFYLPFLSYFEIKREDEYKLDFIDSTKVYYFETFLLISLCLRGFVCLVVLFVVNFIGYNALNRRMKLKKTLRITNRNGKSLH